MGKRFSAEEVLAVILGGIVVGTILGGIVVGAIPSRESSRNQDPIPHRPPPRMSLLTLDVEDVVALPYGGALPFDY